LYSKKYYSDSTILRFRKWGNKGPHQPPLIFFTCRCGTSLPVSLDMFLTIVSCVLPRTFQLDHQKIMTSPLLSRVFHQQQLDYCRENQMADPCSLYEHSGGPCVVALLFVAKVTACNELVKGKGWKKGWNPGNPNLGNARLLQ